MRANRHRCPKWHTRRRHPTLCNAMSQVATRTDPHSWPSQVWNSRHPASSDLCFVNHRQNGAGVPMLCADAAAKSAALDTIASSCKTMGYYVRASYNTRTQSSILVHFHAAKFFATKNVEENVPLHFPLVLGKIRAPRQLSAIASNHPFGERNPSTAARSTGQSRHLGICAITTKGWVEYDPDALLDAPTSRHARDPYARRNLPLRVVRHHFGVVFGQIGVFPFS
mmetsp:Transcript_12629/g.36744  ORF Transcript_12629/g.36744 Transcript_12629/m.36744 type:complete len:225 (-) Transcript_12629:3440-4114(-)